MTTPVTPDAVEAAARALHAGWCEGEGECAGPHSTDRHLASVALAAAAPLIAQQAVEWAVSELGRCGNVIDNADADWLIENTARAATLTPKEN